MMSLLREFIPLEFAHSEYFPMAVIAVAAILLSGLWCAWHREQILRRFGIRQSGQVYGTWRVVLYGLLVTAAASVIALLLLRPFLILEEQVPEYEPLDMVIAIDASHSMLAQATENECGPSRLDMAKSQIDRFLEYLDQSRNDQVGLVVFTRIGYRLVPLMTRDYDVIRTVLAEFTDAEIALGGLMSGTNHWDALSESTKIFDKRSEHKRILMIITDGEPDAPKRVLAATRAEALQRTSELGDLDVYLIGIGDPLTRYPIPMRKGGSGCPLEFMVQEEGPDTGNLIMTTMDQPWLRSLAGQLGGFYRHAQKDTDLLTAMRGIVDAERRFVGSRKIISERDISHELLCTLFALLLLIVAVKSP